MTKFPAPSPALTIHLGIDHVGRALASQSGEEILRRHDRHLGARGHRRTPDMRHQHDIVQPHESLGNLGFVLEHIQGCSGNPPFLKGTPEDRLIDDGATRRVDEVGNRLHHTEFSLTDQVRRVGSERHVQADKVCLLQEDGEVDPGGAQGSFHRRIEALPIIVQHQHAKAAGSTREVPRGGT